MLLYALHVENTLDVEKLLRENLKSQNLKGTAMTTAAMLEAKGRTEGLTAGRMIGSISTLEQVLHLPPTPLEALESMTVPELEKLQSQLQAQLNAR